jgi:hypothetical protein
VLSLYAPERRLPDPTDAAAAAQARHGVGRDIAAGIASSAPSAWLGLLSAAKAEEFALFLRGSSLLVVHADVSQDVLIAQGC